MENFTVTIKVTNRTELVIKEKAKLNPNADQITGVICGYRVEEIENPLRKSVGTLTGSSRAHD